jgi:hypothetical protein
VILHRTHVRGEMELWRRLLVTPLSEKIDPDRKKGGSVQELRTGKEKSSKSLTQTWYIPKIVRALWTRKEQNRTAEQDLSVLVIYSDFQKCCHI